MPIKESLKKFWKFLNEDTWQSWLVSLVLIVIIIKFIFFPTLSFITQTPLPLVVVESCSMYHQGNFFSNFDNWFERHEVKYNAYNVAKEEFQDFSPSLGRINAPQRGFVRLEQNLSESSSVNENNSDNGDPFKYNAIAGNKEQPKYMSYENQLTSNLMQVPEIEKFERKASWERTEIMFQNSPDAKSSSENTFEKYNPVKKFDQKEFQKEDILSRKEIKYSPTKP